MRRKREYIRLGFLGFRRLGFIPFLGLLLAFTLFLQGTGIYRQVDEEKRQPLMLTAMCQTDGDLLCEELKAAEGVEAAAAAIPLTAQLCLGDYSCELTLYGVDASWLDTPQEGAVYPEASSMPWLVLNQEALEAFRDESGNPVAASEINWQKTEITVNGLVGQVCGITDDDGREACGYISVRMAKYMIRNAEETPGFSRVFIRVSRASYAAEITQMLAEKGASVTENIQETGAQWEQLLYRARLNLLSAGAVLILSAALIVEKNRRDMAENKDEYRFLTDYGAGKGEIRLLLAARALPSILLAAVGAVVIRGLL